LIFKNLFITKPGLRLRIRSRHLIIKGNNVDKEIPLNVFSNVFILSNVNISPQTLKYLSENGKYIFILSATGEVSSIILPKILLLNNRIREKQYKWLVSNELKIYIIKELLRRKAKLSQNCLIRFRELRGEPANLTVYKEFFRDVSFLIDNTTIISRLRDLDAFIMRNLLLEFSSSIKEFFSSKGYSCQPLISESNVVLNLIFSMFYSILFPVVIFYDLDPYHGFFCMKKGKYAALVSDLMELAKPKLIFFTADILNRGIFTASDFKYFESKIYLKSNAVNVLCKLLMEKIIYSNIFFPIQLFVKEVLLK